MKYKCVNQSRRTALLVAGAGVALGTGLFGGSGFASEKNEEMELVIDHVMFPTYLNDSFLKLVEEIWRARDKGRVFTQPANPSFKSVYIQSKSFYIEYLSNVETEPYWSNAVYVVVPKHLWKHYENPAFVNDHFLIPYFGCGYQLVSPDYPYLNAHLAKAKNVEYDGLVLLISQSLEKELLSIGGVEWILPIDGKIRVNEKLSHLHDMAVIDDNSKLIAPILQPNPILREYL